MKYDFSKVIDRSNTGCTKWDEVNTRYGFDGLLPMWVADMDFVAPHEVVDAIVKRANHGIFGYVTEPDSYYKAIVGWIEKRHSWTIDRDWIFFSPGVVPALSFCVLSYTQPGDKIIIQPPVYYPFNRVISANGRFVVTNPLILRNGRYSMDFADLEEKASDPQVKMLLLCSPHNPVGRVWEQEELVKLGEICLKHNVLVVADEIHSDIILPGHKHTPFPAICQEFAENSVYCNAPSKTFNLAGLKTSYLIISNKTLADAYSNITHSLSVTKNNVFGAIALEAAYEFGKDWLNQLLIYLKDNIEYLKDFVTDNIPQIEVIEPEGTYLVWLDFRHLGLEDNELNELLLKKAKVALSDGATFGSGGKGFKRMNIACPRLVLAQGLTRIATAIQGL